MSNFEFDKHKRIYEILSIVKLAALLFSGVAFFRSYFDNRFVLSNTKSFYTSLFCIILVLLLSLVYIVWTFPTDKKNILKDDKYIQFAEGFIFTVIFFTAILISGGYESSYKFLFLFIIITSTIQSGMKQGIIIACISSVIILAIDILGVHSGEVNSYFENDLILVGVFILTAWPLGFYVKIEGEHIEELKRLVNEDGLTGLYNHRFFYEVLNKKILSCEVERKPVSMILMDIDYFKYYNDLYGHQKGDEVLKSIGLILKSSVRKTDIVARYGGEEFAIVLTNTIEEDAIKIAENIRSKIEETYFEGEENQPNGKITVSIGVSVYPDKAKNDVELIKSADDALYRAKFFNKNRVETYTSILDELKKDIEESDIDLVTSIKTLISVINAKDRYTYGHVERVVAYGRILADKLGLSNDDKKKLIYGAYMHDIGKINISKEVLNKKMPLTNEEWELLKQHPQNGVAIIKPVKSLRDISSLILHHHERYDGKGYPGNLKGEEIPFLARVLTVVDSFDAMTSNRPYNKRKTYEEAIEELKKCSGTQFDPSITNSFIEVITKEEYKILR
ncbi:putative diguanylate cyclase YdaM [Clostridium homopropionicum DSM 5847]|uniref:Putative diguanylate cyclase YdaM n=1 Tax=Clostridium homopropionicum DSM 5847 TaxID=1121318 RepID=A0A0L6ZB50_9CLOT|nr:HD-GYP domain-containing protein [Clostridium homopropionicum]KOA20199.1 putative diguanylate cyclase YdaM [Clostridium homopropionicum DSM 5847]SFG59471.1 diguanylate cyclase (GGDEF) domain-containing protein [Clostridium homopropionicum]